MIRSLAPFALLLLAGCAAYPATPAALPPVTQPAPGGSAAIAEARAPVTILISIDGFRPDYLDRGVTPNLSRLAATGVSGAMQPAFPTKTFPNHWTIVTGKTPDHNGIVANTMEDPRRPGETFTMASDDPFWWNEAEPIWVTAERAGVPTATMFWPGSNVAWGGTRASDWPNHITGGERPHDWQQFNQAVSPRQRVDAVIDWLRRPAANRPRLVTLYFDEVDTAGHEDGPDAPETTQAVADVDRWIGTLVSELATLGQPANFVIVSDHGMAATSSDRVVALDRIVPVADARVIESGPYATFVPAPGKEAAVASALLRPHPHMTCWRREAMPARLAYGTNPRVPPLFCLGESGWTLAKSAPSAAFAGGAHGYDNADPAMRALFIANGPAFARDKRIDGIRSVDVAPLLRTLLGLPAGQGLDGSTRPFQGALATR